MEGGGEGGRGEAPAGGPPLRPPLCGGRRPSGGSVGWVVVGVAASGPLPVPSRPLFLAPPRFLAHLLPAPPTSNLPAVHEQEIQKKRTEKPEQRAATRDAALREVRDRIKKTKEAKKEAKQKEVKSKGPVSGGGAGRECCPSAACAFLLLLLWWWLFLPARGATAEPVAVSLASLPPSLGLSHFFE